MEEGTVKIIFVRSEDNDADVFTKNVGEQVYAKHTVKFMDEKE